MDHNPVYGMPKACTQPSPHTDQPYHSYPTTEVQYYSAVGGNIYAAPQRPESGGAAPNLSARAEYYENENMGPGRVCHVNQGLGLEPYAVLATVGNYVSNDSIATERTEYYVNEGMGPETQSQHSTHSIRV